MINEVRQKRKKMLFVLRGGKTNLSAKERWCLCQYVCVVRMNVSLLLPSPPLPSNMYVVRMNISLLLPSPPLSSNLYVVRMGAVQ